MVRRPFVIPAARKQQGQQIDLMQCVYTLTHTQKIPAGHVKRIIHHSSPAGEYESDIQTLYLTVSRFFVASFYSCTHTHTHNPDNSLTFWLFIFFE